MNFLDLKIGKIVGSANKKTWSQNHVFLPEDKEKRLVFGNLFLSISLASKLEDLDVPSFGKEIISRFHETYYTSKLESNLEKLKVSLKTILDEFKDKVEVEIAAAVIMPPLETRPVGYFISNIQKSIFISRKQALVDLFANNEGQIKKASGFIENNDLIILGTSQFLKIIPIGTLKVSLQDSKVTNIIETLAPIIHGHEKNSKTAAIVIKMVKSEKQIEETSEGVKDDDGKEAKKKISLSEKLGFVKTFWQRMRQLNKNKAFYLPLKKELATIRIQDEERKIKAKKTTLTVAILLIALLIISIALGTKKRTDTQDQKAVKMLQDEVGYRLEQANSLAELNPVRARLMLIEAKDLIGQNLDSIEAEIEREKIKSLLKQVEETLEKIAKEYKYDEANIFLDFSLAKEGFKGSNWGVVEDDLLVYDPDKGTVLKINIENKSAEVVGGGDKIKGGRLTDASDQRIFIIKDSNLFVIDIKRSEIIDEIKGDEWGNIVNLSGFANNAYLLDAENSQIWKYSGLDSGLGKQSKYLTEEVDLSDAVSMSIDGSVWILFKNGDVEKFVRGKQDVFNASGLDKEFAEALAIYTDENLDNLYAVDRRNTRIVVFNKDTGEYQAQYVWPGIAGIADLAVFEEKKLILLLTGERIYEIELKE